MAIVSLWGATIVGSADDERSRIKLANGDPALSKKAVINAKMEKIMYKIHNKVANGIRPVKGGELPVYYLQQTLSKIETRLGVPEPTLTIDDVAIGKPPPVDKIQNAIYNILEILISRKIQFDLNKLLTPTSQENVDKILDEVFPNIGSKMEANVVGGVATKDVGAKVEEQKDVGVQVEQLANNNNNNGSAKKDADADVYRKHFEWLRSLKLCKSNEISNTTLPAYLIKMNSSIATMDLRVLVELGCLNDSDIFRLRNYGCLDIVPANNLKIRSAAMLTKHAKDHWHCKLLMLMEKVQKIANLTLSCGITIIVAGIFLMAQVSSMTPKRRMFLKSMTIRVDKFKEIIDQFRAALRANSLRANLIIGYETMANMVIERTDGGASDEKILRSGLKYDVIEKLERNGVDTIKIFITYYSDESTVPFEKFLLETAQPLFG